MREMKSENPYPQRGAQEEGRGRPKWRSRSPVRQHTLRDQYRHEAEKGRQAAKPKANDFPDEREKKEAAAAADSAMQPNGSPSGERASNLEAEGMHEEIGVSFTPSPSASG